MTERTSDRWVSIVLSVLLHGALAAALVYGWWTYHQRSKPPTPTLAIEATVVDSRSMRGAATPTPPAPTPPPPAPAPEPQTQPQVEPEGPPQPTPEELAQRAQAQKQQEEKAQQAQEAQRDAERQAQLEAQQKADEKHRAEEQKLAQQKADAERRAKEDAAARQKKQEDDKRKAEEAAERTQMEADLKRSLAAEERLNAARSSGALASWQAQITARIQRAWLRPPSAKAGIECILDVTQVPGGEVTNVRLGACNGDQAVRDSIVAAVYRASPLPPPPDPSLFERNLEITFKPD